MKKIVTVGLIFLTFLILLNPLGSDYTFAQNDKEYDGDDEDSTEVTWTLGSGSGSCWVDITAHNSLDIGDYGFGTGSDDVEPGESIDSEGIAGEGRKKVQVNSNCKDDLDTTVYASGFDLPDGHPETQDAAIQDFYVKSDTGNLKSYTPFPGIGGDDEDNVLSVGTHSGPSNQNYVMDYKYEIDENDVSGDYKVNLVYTVTKG
ncbi:MAG: hypothetical protein ACLFTO_05440 [Candidatus Acetothermia bacterium]